LKFGDIVTAVASLTILDTLIYSVLLAVLIPVNFYWGPDVAGIVSVLLASLIVGYVFAAKIHEESWKGAIGRIVVLSTVVLTFASMALFANPYLGATIKEAVEGMFSTDGWATMEWLAYSQMVLVMLVALNVVLALVFTFIGLYAGSMLKRGAKK